jgi:hypothetical protein
MAAGVLRSDDNEWPDQLSNIPYHFKSYLRLLGDAPAQDGSLGVAWLLMTSMNISQVGGRGGKEQPV